MRHRTGFNALGLKSGHRKALHKNLVTSLFRYERVKTTKAKALAIRRTAEKMITRAKIDSVHNRRIIAKKIGDKEILAKLFTIIAPIFRERPGGYTRVLKIGQRDGDAAEMVILELVEKSEKKDKKDKKTEKKEKKDLKTIKEPELEPEPEPKPKPKPKPVKEPEPVKE